MRQLILRRVVASIFVLILASMLVFTLSRASGDPRNLFLTEYTTKEDWEEWGKVWWEMRIIFCVVDRLSQKISSSGSLYLTNNRIY